MRERVGESFDAVVSSVMAFGLFVRLPEFGVDGLVHVSALPRDYYHRDPSGAALVGERTGHRYALMDSLRVTLAGVNLEERKIDFALETISKESPEQAAEPGAAKQRKRRRKRGG